MPNHKELAQHIHQSNVDAGWWTNIETGERLDRNFGEMLALTHSELSECWEGFATKLPDHHLPTILNWHVELADACIRVYDMIGGCFSDDLVFLPFKLDVPEGFLSFEDRIVYLHAVLSRALEAYRHSNKAMALRALWQFLDACYEMADDYAFNLEHVLHCKWEYNKDRLDHKIENRLKDDGKKI